MNKLIILSLVLYFQASAMAQNKVSASAIIKLSDCGLEVRSTDEPGSLTWYDAKVKCESFGEGWRMPTKAELDCLYKNKDVIGGFNRDYYWSSERVGDWNVWVQAFNNGRQFGYSGSNSAKLRVVRSIKK
jgi:hypothetical protein